MPQQPYQVFKIQQEWVLEPEALGSKEKFWYQENDKGSEWLFKYPQENTGQHWAEKIAAEVAASLGILHARVELAAFGDSHGSATESFTRRGRSLFHGNQILAGRVLGYDPDKAFRQSDHTLTNIFAAIDSAFVTQWSARKAKMLFAGYLVFDALIGNTDRHHENWGVLIKQVGNQWAGILAPTFDHASSLGRELGDSADGPCRERFLREKRVGAYSEKAHGGIFWDNSDRRGTSPLELARR
ncbi:MAG TPA: HipA domain-containing protein, partial [Terriglobia bacterium]|nr:HipA domain-containing protein [Terriglobia bacterium]